MPARRIVRGRHSLLPAACAAALLPACTPRTAVVPPPVQIAHEAGVASFDPVAAADTISHSVLSNFYEALADFDPDMRLQPRLAVSWSAPSERVWEFELRPDVRFHDGGLLTASDVKCSIERARDDDASALEARIWTVAEVQSLAAERLRVRTHIPDPLLVNRLASVLIHSCSRRADLASRPIGTGPYRFVGRSRDGIDAEAFPGHWAGPPAVERVRFRAVEFGAETLRALESGSLDVVRWVPEDLATRVDRLPGTRLAAHPSLRALYLWMNARRDGTARNPFADRRVRQALSLALDRRAIVARLAGRARPLSDFLPAGIVGHSPSLPEMGPDLVASRRLLRAAGFPHGFDTALVHASAAQAEVEVIAAQLAPADIRVHPTPMDWPSMLAAWRGARLPLFLGSWRFEHGDGGFFLEECLFSRYPRMASSWNPGYSDPRLDKLIAENLRIPESGDRMAQFARITRLLRDEMPVVPLLSRVDLYAVSADLEWEPRMDGRLLATEMRPRSGRSRGQAERQKAR